MINELQQNRQELERELQQTVRAFFEANDQHPDSVSIQMHLNNKQQSGSAAIHILVKEGVSNLTQ